MDPDSTDPRKLDRRTVALEVAGRTYRVVTTASEEELRRLAGVVEERLQTLTRGRRGGPEALVLTAISLAHDAEEQRIRAEALREAARSTMSKLLEEVDEALADVGALDVEEDDEPTE